MPATAVAAVPLLSGMAARPSQNSSSSAWPRNMRSSQASTLSPETSDALAGTASSPGNTLRVSADG